MLRALITTYTGPNYSAVEKWLVSFDGHNFYEVDEMPKLSNMEKLREQTKAMLHISDGSYYRRTYLEGQGVNIETISIT